MTLSFKTQVIAALLLILVSFAVGRYSVSQPNIKTQDVSKIQETDKQAKDTHTQTKTVVDKLPSGETKTTTTTDTTILTKTQDTVKDTQSYSQSVTSSKSKLNVSAIAEYDLKRGGLNYGISVEKEVLGPITAGLYGLNNGTIGVSIGLNF
jgi:ribosomal protein S25